MSQPTYQDDLQRTALDDVSDPGGYTPVREAYLAKTALDSLTKKPPKADRDMIQYEDYLREKWGCTEAMPDSFDPDKLEEALRARFPRKKPERLGEARSEATSSVVQKVEESHLVTAPPEPRNTSLEDGPGFTPDDIPLGVCDASYDTAPCRSTVEESPDAEVRDAEYGSEESATDSEAPRENIVPARRRSNLDDARRHGMVILDPLKRTSTPRILAGSKPPLSRSAYVVGGGPCPHEGCQGVCKKESANARVKPPGYFPFESRTKQKPSRPKTNNPEKPNINKSWI